MESQEALTPWQIWNGFKAARTPLKLLIDFSEVRRRMEVNKWPLSETAFVHRMFDLFFTLRDDNLRNELTEKEEKETTDFWKAYENLPWNTIPSHPHVSELDSLNSLIPLKKKAERVDEILSRRTEMRISSMWYRYRRGLRIFEPKMKHIKSVDTTAVSAPR